MASVGGYDTHLPTASGLAADADNLAAWTSASRDRAPFQWPAWYRAAGWLDRVRLLAGQCGRAVLPVWATRAAEHYYHHPATLLTGHREESFTGGLGNWLPAARAALQQRTLLTVSPYGYRGGALHAVPTDGLGDTEELSSLARAVIAHARESGAGLLLSHYLFDEDDGPWLAALTAAGGIPVVLGADAVLDVAWADLAEYRRWLGSSRRYAFSRGSAAVTWRVTELGGSGAQDGVARLLHEHAAVFENQSPPPQGLFDALIAGLGPRALLFSAGPPVGPARSAVLVLRRDDVLYAKFFGTTQPRADYFPLVYTRLIGYAIEHGCRRIEYGGGSHQAKLLRGARLRPALGVLWTADESRRALLESVCGVVGGRKLAHFGALARRWQMPGLPLADRYSRLNCPSTSDPEVRHAMRQYHRPPFPRSADS